MTTRTTTPRTLLLAALCVGGIFAAASRADDRDDDDDDDDDAGAWTMPAPAPSASAPSASSASTAATASAPSPERATYVAECGACHMAHPPELLPARSWEKTMGGLADHFGQNAELDQATRATLTTWLTQNAAEHSASRLARRVVRDSAGQTPLRISELGFIAREHREVDARVWTRPSVGSVAQCVACHRQAERGSFNEHDIRIPR